jgi:hypothetical protein
VTPKTLQDIEDAFWGGVREQPTRTRLKRVIKAIKMALVDELDDVHRLNGLQVRAAAVGILNELGGISPYDRGPHQGEVEHAIMTERIARRIAKSTGETE